jgi:hypothetical protein
MFLIFKNKLLGLFQWTVCRKNIILQAILNE